MRFSLLLHVTTRIKEMPKILIYPTRSFTSLFVHGKCMFPFLLVLCQQAYELLLSYSCTTVQLSLSHPCLTFRSMVSQKH